MGIRRASIQTTADSTVSFQAIQPQTGGYSGTSVTSIVYTDNNYNTVSANAANVTYGTFRILGAGFISSSNVLIQNTSSGLSNNITSNTTFIGSGEIRANVSASIGSNYNLYVYNSTGTAGYIGGLSFEPAPYFVANTLSFSGANTAGFINNVTMNVYSIAVSNAVPNTITFALASGNTLPSGLTLYSNGVISGNLAWPGGSSQTWSANVIVFNAYNQVATSNIALVIATTYIFSGFNTPATMPYNGNTATMAAVTVSSSGLYVAVGMNSVTWPVAASSTNGTTWTAPSLMNGYKPALGVTIASIAVSNSGLFVIVGFDSNGYPISAVSTDGNTWTTPTPWISSSNFASAVTYYSGLFVATGYNGPGYPTWATSTNGTSWTQGTMNGSTTLALMWAVAVSNSGLYVSVGRNTSFAPLYAYSTNGSTWTTPALMNGSSTYAVMKSIAVNSSGLFVAVGYNNSSYPLYAYSTNGSNWTTPALMNGSTVIASMYGVYVNSSGLFVAVGYNTNTYAVYATSTNGSTWTTPALMNGYSNISQIQAIVADNTGHFLAVGYNSTSNGIYALSN